MDATVVVATFGEASWKTLALERAIPSAQRLGVPVIHKHRETLAQARNAGLAEVETEFAVHLDADDQLDVDYFTEMAKGRCDLRAPSRLDIDGNGDPMGEPYMPRVWAHEHDCQAKCLRYGNWMVVGTAVRADLAREVGGWEEWGWSEDWALWARCWHAGGTVEALPKAIYRAWRARRSRNRVPNSVGVHWHKQIEAAIWG